MDYETNYPIEHFTTCTCDPEYLKVYSDHFIEDECECKSKKVSVYYKEHTNGLHYFINLPEHVCAISTLQVAGVHILEAYDLVDGTRLYFANWRPGYSFLFTGKRETWHDHARRTWT